MSKSQVRLIAIGVSLANLLMLDVWRTLFLSSSPASFSLRTQASDFVAAIVTVVGLGIAFAVAVQAARRTGRPLVVETVRIAFLATTLIFAETLRRVYEVPVGAMFHTLRALGPAVVLISIGGLAGAWALIRWRKPLSHAYAVLLVILLPATAVTFGRAIWAMWHTDFEVFADQTNTEFPASGTRGRVVVLLFDELDYDVAFVRRPTELPLPELDRFWRESAYAGPAQQPAMNTLESIASYLTGEHVVHAVGTSPRTMQLEMSSGQTVSMDSVSTLFESSARRGARVGIAGDVLPYCRLAYARFVRRCFWIPAATGGVGGLTEADILSTSLRQIESLTPWFTHALAVERYRASADSARAMITDSTLDFVWVHLNLPHRPAIFDRQRRTMSTMSSWPEGYFDNLALTDETLGTFRSAMERSGLWNRTMVIITADHHWRTAPDPTRLLVPFAVRLPRDASPIPADASFDALALRDVVTAGLGGGITSASLAALTNGRDTTLKKAGLSP